LYKAGFVILCCRGFRGVAVVAAICSSACGPRLMKLPSGPGTTALDIGAAQVQATEACRRVNSMSAEIAAKGSVSGQRLRGRLIGGFTPTATRLEAPAPFGAPIFIFVAHDDDATLLLPRDARVVEHGRPAEVLEAVAGVPLTPSELLRTLTGCYVPDRLDRPLAFGDLWRSAAGGGGAKMYLHRETAPAPWRIVSVFFPGEGLRAGWRADYDQFVNGLPTVVRLVSSPPDRFNLELSLSQVETNIELKPEVFRVEIPPGIQRITLDEIKRARPSVREN
jgi:hypothetical protein